MHNRREKLDPHCAGAFPVCKHLLFAFITYILLAGVLFGCSSAGMLPPNMEENGNPPPPGPQMQSSVDAIKEKGTIVIGTSITKPFEYYDPETHELVGFDVDLANAIADDLGVSIEWVDMPFANLLPALEDQKVDMTIAAMYITADREEVVDFSQPYLRTGLVMVTTPDKINQIHSINDLSGLKVGVKIGATGEELANHLVEEGIALEPVGYKDTFNSLLDLEVKRVDVVFNDYLNTIIYQNDFESNLQIVTNNAGEIQYLSSAGLGIAVHQPNPQLLEEINNILLRLESKNEIRQLYDKWFNSPNKP